MNLLQRAYHGLNLTPGERAALKLAQGTVIAALGSGFAAVAQYLAVGNVNDLTTVAQVGGIAFGVAILNALHKYASAQTDQPLLSPLGALAGTLADDLGTLGANLPKVPATPVDAADGTPADGGGVPAASPDQASVPAPVPDPVAAVPAA